MNTLKIILFLSSLISHFNASQSAESKNLLSDFKQDIDIEDLFKGEGPKILHLESYKDFKPPIILLADKKYYVDENCASMAYSKSKSRRNFAAHLTKLIFTPRERLESNCNGRFGKKALDSARLNALRNTLFKYYPCKQSTLILNGDKITSGDHDENSVWVRDCVPAIDESNRVLKKQLISWYKKNQISSLKQNFKSQIINNKNSLISTCENKSDNFILEKLSYENFEEKDEFEETYE